MSEKVLSDRKVKLKIGLKVDESLESLKDDKNECDYVDIVYQ